MDICSKSISVEDSLVGYKYLMAKFNIKKSKAYEMINSPEKYNLTVPIKQLDGTKRVLKSSVDLYFLSLFKTKKTL